MRNCALVSGFQSEGDAIMLLDGAGKWAQAARAASWKNFSGVADSSTPEEWRTLSSSEYAKTIEGMVAGAPPSMDLAAENRLIECLVTLAEEKAILSAHDISDGGLAVALAECCFGKEGLSAEVALEGEAPAEAVLFGERGARAVVSLSSAALARVSAIAAQCQVNAQRIGTVTRGELRIQYNGIRAIKGDVDSFRRSWSESLARAVESQ